MTTNGVDLTLTRIQAISYQVQSDRKRQAPTNFLIEVHGTTSDGRELVGLGESQPRDEATGDRLEPSWSLLEAVVHRLADRSFTVRDRSDVVPSALAVLDSLKPLIAEHSQSAARLVPFRGTLVGVESALLDIACRALDVPLTEVLGSRHDKVDTHAEPIPAHTEGAARAERLQDQVVRFPAVRLFGTADPAESLELLEAAAAQIADSGRALWIDMQRKLTRHQATEFVRDIAGRMATGRLPRNVVIEHPVPYRDVDHETVLQRIADRALARSAAGADLLIMADQSQLRPETLGRRARLRRRFATLMRRSRLRAIQLRPAEVGGVVATLELAEVISRSHPGARICLGSMPGSTEITGGLIRNLAMAMPQLDSVVDDTLATEPTVVAPTGPGIGARTNYEHVLGGAQELISVPPPAAPSHGGLTMNQYDDVDVIRPLGLNFTKGFLLEREALARGLSTRRFTRSAFMASDGEHEALTFKKSRTPLSSAVAMALCTHKEATRLRLKRAGVPVPDGMTFAHGDYAAAKAFVERIGYPVVVKPAMGVSGVGVAANIGDDDALQHAFDQLAATRFGSGDFIIEQHVRGYDHRIVVVGDEVVGAIMRDPASVDGDGHRTVAELIIAKNLARRANPHLWGRPIKYGEAARYQLRRAGLNLHSVPAPGQKVVLSNSGNLALGADSVDVLEGMHPSIMETCIDAVRAIPGLHYCGIDFLLEDHTKPIHEQQAAICELNAHAAIGNCEYPIYGTPRDAAGRIIDECVDRFHLNAGPARADRLAIRVTIRGDVAGTPAWLKKRALSTGISGWSRSVDQTTAQAVLVGDLQPVAALAAAAITGPRAAEPTEVITEHLESVPDYFGFEIVDQPPQEFRRVGTH